MVEPDAQLALAPSRVKLPKLHRFKIALFLAFGAIVLAMVLTASGFLLVGIALLALTGKGLVLLVKLAKVAWVLLLPAYALLAATYRALTYRQPEVEGTPLRRDQAPALFDALDVMQKQMRGPRVDAVLLVDGLNAFAVTRPYLGFWFIPFRRLYIGLGVSLLQTLSPEEAMAVVAHEYGHLAGLPSGFDAFIYRINFHLQVMLNNVSEWSDWASRIFQRALRRYVATFDRLSFTLRRNAEYAADHASAQLTHSAAAANALVRLRVANAYLSGSDLRDAIMSNAITVAEPNVRLWSQLPVLLRPLQNTDFSLDALRTALYQETETHDTHPALADRLQALGVVPDTFLDGLNGIAPTATPSAAEAWFGDALDTILEPFDREWQQHVRPYWQKLHTDALEARTRTETLQALQAEAEREQRPLETATEWEILSRRLNSNQCEDPLAELQAFMTAHPQHGPSRLTWGQLALEKEAAVATAAIREAALLDPALAGRAAWILAQHFDNQDDDDSQRKAARYRLMARRFS